MKCIHMLIKPVSGMCNLNCDYCFYCDEIKHRKSRKLEKMTEQTIRALLMKFSHDAGTKYIIGFQGGEPTLAGLEYYRQFMKYEKKYLSEKVEIVHTIQTNGYGLDKTWAEFFKKNDFLVGISLDGTKRIHDSHRVTKEGEGTYVDVMQFIDTMKETGAKFNIVTVVTEKMAFSAKRIYRNYRKREFNYLQFIPCLEPMIFDGTEPYLIPKSYGIFLCDLFDEWYYDIQRGIQVYIRQFDDYISILRWGYSESCGTNGYCGIQNVIEADGCVYPCDFFSLDEYCLGNINDKSFADIEAERNRIGFVENSDFPLQECMQCEYFCLCRNGCLRYRETDTQKNRLCEAYKMFFKHAIVQLKEIAYGI